MKQLSTTELASVALLSSLTAVGALISFPIPMSPVPVTLQTFFTLLSGAVLGRKLGALSQLVYILLGLVGLPVFAKGTSGIGILMGPTGGYLMGFVLCAYITGAITEGYAMCPFWKTIIAMSVGICAVYTTGVIQLSIVAGLSLNKAVIAGVLPFVPGDVFKIIAAASLARKIKTNKYMITS